MPTDLSKAFDYILLDLLIAKLAGFSFDYNFLQMLQSYISNRNNNNNDDVYSKYCDILLGVSQDSTLGPLPFNI